MTDEKLKKEAEDIVYGMGYDTYESDGHSDFAVQDILVKFAESKEKRIADLEHEIAKLKGEADSVLDNWCRGDDPCPHLKKREEQLTKAIEIIINLVKFDGNYKNDEEYQYKSELHDKIWEEAELFLKEISE